jgi:type IV pilus assembly protein PilN
MWSGDPGFLTMANINLLPWREELREERRKEFLVGVGITVAIAVLIIFAVDRFVNNAINNQTRKNDYLREQITSLDREISEIRELQRLKSELTERMTVIQDLQGRRPVIVRLFDELVRTLPDGVYYDQIVRNGDQISFEGVAESNNRVSALLRSLEDSEWFEGPDLQQISSNVAGGNGNRFQLSVIVTTPDPEEE